MFSRIYLCFLVASLSACAAAAPHTVSAPARPNALSCAISQASSLGYAVQAAEQNVFFRAERRLPPGRVPTTNRWDVLTVTFAEDRLHVVVDGFQQDVTGEHRQRQPAAPTSEARSHAQTILRTCGGG